MILSNLSSINTDIENLLWKSDYLTYFLHKSNLYDIYYCYFQYYVFFRYILLTYYLRYLYSILKYIYKYSYYLFCMLCKDLTSFLYTFFKLKIQNINIDIENRIQSKAKEKSHENQIESNQIELIQRLIDQSLLKQKVKETITSQPLAIQDNECGPNEKPCPNCGQCFVAHLINAHLNKCTKTYKLPILTSKFKGI